MGLPNLSVGDLTTKVLRELKVKAQDLWKQLNRDNLHFRIFRCVIATAVTALLPGAREIYGRMAYLGPMTTVFILGHPGKRLGGAIEALVLAIIGICVGVGWTTLGLYLGSLCADTNLSASMAIRAVFLVIAMFAHGYVRSITPRLFIMVLLMAVPVVIGLPSTSIYLDKSFVTMLLYPMLTSVAVLFVANIAIFPEFGAMGLGLTTVETLQRTISLLNGATDLFVESCGETTVQQGHHQLDQRAKVVRLAELTVSKTSLRAQAAECKSIYRDCAFDISYSCLPPKELKPLVGKGMSRLVMNVMALIGACESKYALMGTMCCGEQETEMECEVSDDEITEREEEKGKEVKQGKSDGNVPGVRARRAIRGDEQLLRNLLRRVTEPVGTLQQNIDRSIDVISTCVAIIYEVPRLPSPKQGGTVRHPAGVLLQELDIYIDSLSEAIIAFAKRSKSAIEGAAQLDQMGDNDNTEVDIMPRGEVFLICSFLLNLRLAATHTLDMLRQVRSLVEAREKRNGKRGLHWPDTSLSRWLSIGSEDTEAPSPSGPFRSQDDDDDDDVCDDDDQWKNTLIDPSSRGGASVTKAPENENQENEKREYRDSTNSLGMRNPGQGNINFSLKFRGWVADFLDYVKDSDHMTYAFKFTLGITLITWPAFVPGWTLWYEDARAIWVALIFILMFENAVGSTVWMIFLRAVGTLLGSTLGYAAYQSGHGNEISMGVIIVVLLIPAYYIQLGTKYQKAAMIFSVTMCVVSLSTHLHTVPGTSLENFSKRAVASLISGGIAFLIHITIFPVKARTKLKEYLASAISQINIMESCYALGVDEKQIHMLKHPRFLKRFEFAAKKANAALSAAEAFLDHANHEPRVKGEWEPYGLIYKEILFVLRQIVERMENLLRLRNAFGSAVLEGFNTRVHAYRRNIAAAMTLTLYAVQQSLTQKLPLPQFLPSARLAHMRMVVKVRQILHEESKSGAATPKANLSRPESISDLQQGVQQSCGEPDEICLVAVPTPYSALPSRMLSFRSAGNYSLRRHALKLKLLSWNASSAALEECVEYVEELVELVKLLVGVNEFRSGLFHRPTLKEYLGEVYSQNGEVRRGTVGNASGTGAEAGTGSSSRLGASLMMTPSHPSTRAGGEQIRAAGQDSVDGSFSGGHGDEENIFHLASAALPHPLTRIQSRREQTRLNRKKE